MATAIVNIPQLVQIPPFPALGDAEFNVKAYTWGYALPGCAINLREIAAAARTCAIASSEHAQAALASAQSASASLASVAQSASNANNAASEASASRQAAAQSATSAQAALVAMQQFYLGPKTAHPTKNNQGGALAPGCWYTNIAESNNVALLERLQSIKGQAVIAGYLSALYDDMLKGWRRIERPHRAAGSKRPRTEVLWISP